MITYVCQNFGVRDIRGQIPKSLQQALYLLPSDFPNNFSKLFIIKVERKIANSAKVNIEISFKKRNPRLNSRNIFQKNMLSEESKALFFGHF